MERKKSRSAAKRDCKDGSRRGFLKTGLNVVGASVAAGPLLSGVSDPSSRSDAQVRERIERQGHDPRGRILIKGATIISMDPQVGDFLKGDLLIEGKKINEVAKEIKAMANVAGVPVADDVAARIANSIGPAFDGFAPIAGTLPFDLEPATFVAVQATKAAP